MDAYSPLLLNAEQKNSVSRLLTHSHDYHQIVFITKGCVNARINGHFYAAKAPCLMIVSSYEAHSFDSDGAEYERFCLSISTYTSGRNYPVNNLLSVLTRRGEDFSHVIDVSACADRFYEICARILREYQNPKNEYSKFASDLYLYELLLCIHQTAPGLTNSTSDVNNNITWRIQGYIEENYSRELSVAAIAQTFGISESKLSHSFKKLTGYAVLEYITICRMSAARYLLQYSDKSVLNISLETGYNDVNHFCRIFKQKNGCTPREYRQNVCRPPR